jgi:molybdopterin molybdotransferase
MLRAMNADVIFTSGGVSKGDFDLVRLMIGKYGRVVFSRIQMGPGASFAFGLVNSGDKQDQRQTPVFALAGPPTGCLINFETLARPALRKLLGYSNLRHAEVQAVALDAARNRAPFDFARWTELIRSDQGYQVKFGAAAGPGALASLASSNSLTILPKGTEVQPGDKVTVLPMDWAL